MLHIFNTGVILFTNGQRNVVVV